MTDASGMIVAAVVVTAGTTFVAQVTHGSFVFRSYLAASFLGIMLAFLAMINEQLARNFALLVILVALVRNGDKTFSFFSRSSAPQQAGTEPKNPVRFA